ncbi:hypothetical protein C5Z25_03050 [Lactobacillus sp. CBA3605]|uniref:DUF805 domain-containing protein n=1 Tax=Lactobacillus sp. CBA3605 TaxID=2099788 RepID=UPI000CFB8857|nr:DUF805 domain-containing protein [Lactobacillus sp. CBA3605]AVK60789.1 hypothetical protein C5Z25_03050 [Lactobacillus sp. CBA3605]
MSFCPRCGSKIDRETRFCPNCGLDLSQISTDESTVVTPPVTPTMNPAQPQVTRNQATPNIDYQSNLGLVGAFKEYFSKYAQFRGRMSRANYWWSILAYELCYLVLMAIYLLFDAQLGQLLLTIFSAVFCLPSLTAVSRRLHDGNRSFANYWWMLLPIVGWIYLLVLLCRRGDTQANRFE